MSLIGRNITVRQKVGLIIMVFLCGMPGMELSGFGFGLNLTFSTCLICAVTGGAIGGLLYCSKPVMAGLGGGIVAGVGSLMAVYFYTMHRQSVWNFELALIQIAGCLPGLGLGMLIKHLYKDIV